jgi:hypothetical protein
MEKTAEDDGPRPTFKDHREEYEVLKGRVPGHHNFGQRVCARLGNGRFLQADKLQSSSSA